MEIKNVYFLMGKAENMAKEVARLIRMKKAVKKVLQNIEEVDTSKTILRDCPPVSKTGNRMKNKT